ncbi:hypothetical protein IMZ48_39350 [Candidatus Bathyarchaeota archaeon]|nr:hypothetical protein [Candidatus Bathyarchaeota archaeon]
MGQQVAAQGVKDAAAKSQLNRNRVLDIADEYLDEAEPHLTGAPDHIERVADWMHKTARKQSLRRSSGHRLTTANKEAKKNMSKLENTMSWSLNLPRPTVKGEDTVKDEEPLSSETEEGLESSSESEESSEGSGETDLASTYITMSLIYSFADLPTNMEDLLDDMFDRPMEFAANTASEVLARGFWEPGEQPALDNVQEEDPANTAIEDLPTDPAPITPINRVPIYQDPTNPGEHFETFMESVITRTLRRKYID